MRTDRADGPLPGVPEDVYSADLGLSDGPWMFGFANKQMALLIVDATAGELDICASSDGAEFVAKLSVTVNTGNEATAALVEAAGLGAGKVDLNGLLKRRFSFGQIPRFFIPRKRDW